MPVLLLTTACKDELITMVNDQQGLFPEKWALVKAAELNFPLDSATSTDTEMVQYFENNRQRLYAQLNGFNNSIYLYEFPSAKLLKIIRCHKEGDQGVGIVTGFHIVGIDSIYVYSYGTQKLSLINSNGEVLSKKYMRLEAIGEGKYLPSPQLRTNMPMAIANGKIYMTGSINGEYEDESEANRPLVVVYDMTTDSLSNIYSYPKSYRIGQWFGRNYRKVYSTFNKDNNLFAYSFPNDHYIYSTDHQSMPKKSYAGSKYFGDIVSTNKHWFFDKDAAFDYYQNQPSYSTIIYDPYRKCYYRIAEHPVSPDEEFYRKPFSIILLDDNFNWVGEYMVPDKRHSENRFFLTDAGLYINRIVNEHNMTYYLYEIKK